ncbi:MAG TPA: phosphoribosyltransferase family protein [Actinomycetota bacterium]|nr:phosphoribosyltransferase family protein [Actinomycetota bacterium]
MPGPVRTASHRPLADLRAEVARVILQYGYERRDEPFQLSSGGTSHDYIDAKRAIARGTRFALVAEAIDALANSLGVTFEAAGGMTMGADPIGVAVAMRTDAEWFSVRKTSKGHGRQRRIEGKEFGPGVSVLLVDDVITSGRSILDALDALKEVDADVVLATTLVDRGEAARPAFEQRGVLYEPLLTYQDLGIDPVG